MRRVAEDQLCILYQKAPLCIEYLQVGHLTLFKDLGLRLAPTYSFLHQGKSGIQGDKSQEDSSIVRGDLIHVYQNLILLIHISMLITTHVRLLTTITSTYAFL